MSEKKQKDKSKSIDPIAEIRKKYGASALTIGNVALDIPYINTRCIPIDMALGIGGIPRGRIVEIFGPESSGKTTLALQLIASAQKAGGVAAFIDAEHALDPRWATKIGCDMDKIIVSQPSSGEEALDIALMLAKSNTVDIIVVDSVAALIPQVELDGEIIDSHIGAQARLMSKGLRSISGARGTNNTSKRAAIVFINQIREKVGVMFGSPEVQPGGRALKFYASVRMDIRKTGVIKDGDRSIGNTTRMKVVKNKVAPPFKEAEFNIMFGENGGVAGIDIYSSILSCAVKLNVLSLSGSWYTYGDLRIGNGVVAAARFLSENNDVYTNIYNQCKEKSGIKLISDYTPEKSEDDSGFDDSDSPDNNEEKIIEEVITTEQ